MERYSTMYPHGQPGQPDVPVTVYIDSLHATSIVAGCATSRPHKGVQCMCGSCVKKL
jgi:hypothetical protein